MRTTPTRICIVCGDPIEPYRSRNAKQCRHCVRLIRHIMEQRGLSLLKRRVLRLEEQISTEV